MHEDADGKECGPVSPANQVYDPSDTTDVHLVQCCACGKDWREMDARRLVQIWWSAGAYEGHEVTMAEVEKAAKKITKASP